METDASQRLDKSVISTFFNGLGNFRRGWPQFFAADIATRVAATLVLTPLVAWIARGALGRAGGGALTDQDILWFVLSPLGIASLLLVAVGSLLAGLIGHTAIMTVAAGIEEDKAVSWLAGMRHAVRRLFGIFRLALLGMARLLVDAAPWLVVAGALYFFLLTDHDINFYLSQKPPRFWIAATLIGISLLGLAWFVGRRLLSWAIALPRLLFGGHSPADALRASAAATEGRMLRVLLLFVIWAGATFGFSAVVTGVSGWIGQLLIPEGSQDLARMATGIGIASVIAFIGNLLISIVSSVVFAPQHLRAGSELGRAVDGAEGSHDRGIRLARQPGEACRPGLGLGAPGARGARWRPVLRDPAARRGFGRGRRGDHGPPRGLRTRAREHARGDPGRDCRQCGLGRDRRPGDVGWRSGRTP